MGLEKLIGVFVVDGDVSGWFDRMRFGVFGSKTFKVMFLLSYRQLHM